LFTAAKVTTSDVMTMIVPASTTTSKGKESQWS